jgi:uncharacterized protein (DUF433 family)
MGTDRIEINPQVMMGKPVIKGTRITVEMLFRKLSEGASQEDLLDAYPNLTGEDIRAAIGFAAICSETDRTSAAPEVRAQTAVMNWNG